MSNSAMLNIYTNYKNKIEKCHLDFSAQTVYFAPILKTIINLINKKKPLIKPLNGMLMPLYL